MIDLSSDEWASVVNLSGVTGMAKEIFAHSRCSMDGLGLVIWVHPDVARLVFHDGELTEAAGRAKRALFPLMNEHPFPYNRQAYIQFEIDSFGVSGHA